MNKEAATTKNNNGDEKENDSDSVSITAAQVVLAWLVQHGISVVPMSTDQYHLRENSAHSIGKIPSMRDEQIRVVAQSVEALISGDDLTEDAFVMLSFHANK